MSDSTSPKNQSMPDEALSLGLGMSWVWRIQPDPPVSRGVVRHAIERGIRWFDVSPAYGDAEARLGEIVREYPDTLHVVNKYYGGDHPDDWSAKGLHRAMRGSLSALGLDAFDVYLLHGPPMAAIDAGLLDALASMRDAGLAKRIGVAGDGDLLVRALESPLVDAVESSVNFLDLASLHMLQDASRTDVLVLAKRALANGAWRNPGGLVHPYRAEYARRLQVSGIQQSDEGWLDTAVRFVAHEPAVDVAFFGSSSIEHIDAVVDAVKRGPLSGEVVERWTQLGHRHPEWVSQP